MALGSGVLTANISPLIPSQFPKFYQDASPIFIAFVQAYYEWLEQQGKPLYYTRNFLDINDIDNTLDSFLVHFKEMFFKNIQFDTQADTRQLIKHALDIYRSKGTERQIKLLFQLIFGEQVEFFYPKTDLFRLSDGVWKVPVYLELALLQTNVLLVHKEVIGVTSGATAFVDSVVRKQDAGGNLVDIAYISAVVGNFQTGEKIVPVDGSLTTDQSPVVSGSLTTVVVASSGNTTAYDVGDLVAVSSATGEGALARVSATATTTGILSFSLNDGGYGYTSASNTFVSNTILVVNNVIFSNSYCQRAFKLFETITEPMVTISYIFANGSFNVGDILSVYTGGGTVTGNGKILSIATTNSTAGNLLVSTISGDLSTNTKFFNQGNVVTANEASIVNSTATGTFIGARNTTFTISSLSGGFLPGEIVLQYIDNGPQYTGQANVTALTATTMTVANVQGIIQSGFRIRGTQSGASANVTNVQTTMGLINVNGAFTSLPGNYITSDSTNATITTATSGTGGQFGIANNLLFPETVSLNTDRLSTYAGIFLNASQYNFPANVTANATNVNVAIAMTNSNFTVGQLQTILPFNAGSGYLFDQFNLVSENLVYGNQKWDVAMYITGATKSFNVGELVTQANSSARGLVQFSNSSIIYLQNLRVQSNNQFGNTVDANSQIVGATSSAVANVVDVEINQWRRPEAVNANVAATVSSSNGAIIALEVIDSGINFVDQQSVVFGPPTDGDGSGQGSGIAFLGHQGVGQGFYAQKGGFLSDVKKLFDGNFWQEFSYQVLSSQTLDKYEQTLKQLAHVAGIALFGKVIHKSVSNNIVRLASPVSETSIFPSSDMALDFHDPTGTDTAYYVTLQN